MGESLSVLDIAWFIYAHRLSLAGYPLARLHPHVHAWVEKLRARPEFAKEIAMPPEVKAHIETTQSRARAGRQDAGSRWRVSSASLQRPRFFSISSQISAATSGPPRFLIARMPVGEVTLISVSQPSITSMPTNSRPRSRSAGPMVCADFALARRQLGFLRRAAAHHVGAQIVGRRHAVDRAGEFAVDQDDALVAVAHRGQEFLDHPGLAEGRGEHVVERAEVEVVLGQAEHRAAAVAVERLHHDVAVLGAERLDLGEVAGDQRRRHQLRELR